MNILTSFYITFVFLITTGTITFIEAVSTQSPFVRHVMNLETCISIIAGYFYSIFVSKMPTMELKDINSLRYTDWTISTPFMLIVLCMVLGKENGYKLFLSKLVIILFLDYAMLLFGYLGETGKIDKKLAWTISSGAFLLMYIMIWIFFMSGNQTLVSRFIYFAYFLVWSIYGMVYFAKEETKNITYNALDLIAKCFIGIFFWAYFTKIIV